MDLGGQFQELAARLVELVLAAGDEQNLRAALREAACDRPSDPPAGAGHQDAPILK
jgi:hypothetical protein